MKHLEIIFRTFLSILILTIAAPSVSAQTEMDSVEVSLLTCSPHEEVYSLYGHSALRWHEQKSDGRDIVFNWGVFNFKKPYFVLRFVFGLTDYELGPVPYPLFEQEYRQVGSSVTEQVLNLSTSEKEAVWTALLENCRPENRIYRYNYFYDNCSTRPRDIIERCIEGKVEYAEREDFTPSYREMIHDCTRNHPWITFGNDMLLGIKADLPTKRQQQEFLPQHLMYDFDYATIYANGEYRPLVKERRVVVAPGVQVISDDFPLSPSTCGVILLVFSLLVCLIEWRQKKIFRLWDVSLMLLQGLVGCLLFVMIFSQHPTTSLNLQLLLFNPLPLFFILPVVRGRKSRWWRILIVMVIGYLLGALFQHYAEGMLFAAFALLSRSIIHQSLKR